MQLGKLLTQVLHEMENTEEGLAYGEMIAPLPESSYLAAYRKRDERIVAILATQGLDIPGFIDAVEQATSPRWTYDIGLYHLVNE